MDVGAKNAPGGFLIVEDEALIAADLKGRLEGMGYPVAAVVRSGEAAVIAAQVIHPSLVCMDIRLPGRIDGIEAARVIRGRDPVPVLFLTAYTDDQLLERAKLAQPAGYLVKPIHTHSLKAGVEMALHSGKAGITLPPARKIPADRQAWRHKILETSEEGIWVIDPQRRIIFANEKMAELLEGEVAAVQGRPAFDFILPRDQEAARAILDRLQPSIFETRLQTLSGRKKWTQVAITPLFSQGQYQGYMGLVTDVTQRRMAGRLSRTMINRSRYGYWLVDAEGRIIEVNRAFGRMVGWGREELVGRWIWEIEQPDPPENIIRQLSGLRKTGSAIYETQLRRKDGTLLPVEASANYLVNGEEYVFAFFRDISDHRRMLADLVRAKAEADKANQAKSALMASVSHEIRTPMTGIIGMTELVLDTDLTGEQREYLTLAKHSAEALLSLLNDILDLSKAEADRLDLERIRFRLRDGLSEVVRTLGPRAHGKGLDLLFHVHPDVPEFLIGDPGRLRQVVYNLVGNAIKFTEHGEVVLNVDLGRDDGREVQLGFQVKDTGPGLTPDEMERVFEPFFQVRQTCGETSAGTGLGLAISQGLIQRMGGRLEVDSHPGQGATFRFALTFPRAEAPARTMKTPAEALVQGKRVLVVDDSPTNLKILEGMFRHWNMAPTSFNDGSSALEELARSADRGAPYHLAVLDVNMPVMNGYELARRIQGRFPAGNVPIIMLTSTGQRGEAARCREMGLAGYLNKPFKDTDLFQVVRLALNPGSAAGPTSELITRHTLREARQTLSLLVVEDNPVNGLLIQRLVEKQGHRVHLVDGGRKALAALDRESFDLVFMDIEMPDMDGLETTRRIRLVEKPGDRRLPVVALTAHAMTGDRERFLEAGLDDYLAKPIQLEALRKILDQAAARKYPCG
jgi:PAS domain S-box-containing protein